MPATVEFTGGVARISLPGDFDFSSQENLNLTFEEALNKNLKVMDMTAFALCRENNIPIIVFNMNKKDNLKKVVLGENIGTFVHN